MIKIAHVGLGNWGQNHFRVFLGFEDCSVKIACDSKKEALDNARSLAGSAVKLTLDFEEIIKDPSIDAVVIATPSETHARLAIKALATGKHVFVEKPLALKIEDAQEMLKLSEKHKKVLMVGHLLLYHPAVTVLKSYADKGELGELRYMYSTRVNLGQVRAEENALWSLTAHDISVAKYFTGRLPLEVSATGKCYIREFVQDVVFVSLGFDNNVMAHIHASWLDPHKVRKFTIVGSKKMAVFDDMEASEKIKIYDKGFDWKQSYDTYEAFLSIRQGDVRIPKFDMVEPLKMECRHFIDCVKTGKRPLTDGENGLEVLKVLTAAKKSIEQNGKPVKIG